VIRLIRKHSCFATEPAKPLELRQEVQENAGENVVWDPDSSGDSDDMGSCSCMYSLSLAVDVVRVQNGGF
jgi:hypothetical protein